MEPRGQNVLQLIVQCMVFPIVFISRRVGRPCMFIYRLRNQQLSVSILYTPTLW